MEISFDIDIDASPDMVWAVLADIESWPEWTDSMTAVTRIDDGPLSVGSKARVEQPKLRTAVWEVTELDAPRSFTWVTRSPGVLTAGGHLLRPSAHDGTTVTLSTTMTGILAPLVRRVLGARIEDYVKAEARGLKRRCEG